MSDTPSAASGAAPMNAGDSAISRNIDTSAESSASGLEVRKHLDVFTYLVNDIHTYLREAIVLADQKGAFLFAALSTFLAYLHSQKLTRRWIADPRTWTFLHVVAFLAVVGLVLGAFWALMAIVPRLKGSTNGTVFWRGVARFESAAAYAEEILGKDPTVLLREKAGHCQELALVCARKYLWLTIGLWIGGIGLAASITYLASV